MKMASTQITAATVLVCLTFLCITTPPTDAQFNPDTIAQLVEQIPMKTKLLLLAGFIEQNPEMYNDLENSLLAALPLLGFDQPGGRFMSYVLPWALHHLPNLLKNEEFLVIMKTFIHEVNAINASADWLLHSGNNTLDREHFMTHLLSALDYPGFGVKILQARTVKEFFPYNSTDRPVNKQCYDDTMAFFDRLFHGDTWALNMFDAIGKPTTGIMRGVLYFIGTFDQCQGIRAEIPINASLGQYRSENEISYKGRYCRATFKPPRSLIENIAGEHINNTYGLPLTLSLGMCLPDSCHKGDIEGLLRLGLLGSLLNISVEKTVCVEEQNFKEDTESHIVVGILGALLILTIVSSAIDLCYCQPKKNTQRDTFIPENMNFHVNDGYVNMQIGDSQKPGKEHVDAEGHIATTDESAHIISPDEIKTKMKELAINDVRYTEAMIHKHAEGLDISMDSDLTGNLLDSKDANESTLDKILRSFSIFTNVPALLTTETKDDVIPCIYGIRVISISWIVLGNTYLYVAQSLAEVPVAVDMLDSYDLMDRFTMQAVMSSSYATDTFFLISGCLISYWFLLKDEMSDTKTNVKTWLKFYAGKYWKMTPPYMLVMVTFVYLYMYLGQGPLWPDKIAVADSCRTDWWKHLLYINNLVGVDGVAPENQCMAWSWYLAVNMQFYLISPILLSFVAFSSSMGLALSGILAIAGIISSGVKEAQYPGEILTSKMDGGAYWNNVFIKPWCRVAPYCVGIVLGFVLQKWYHVRMHKVIAAALWVMSICIGVLLIYIPHTEFVHELGPWTAHQKAAYEALGRPFWALCVGWVIYACTTGHGGPISDFLSWKGFVPLSRLSFMVYLNHPVLMVLAVYSRRTLLHMNDFEMAYQFVGHLVVNFFAAFLLSLFMDMPFRNIKRVVHGKPLETPF